MANTISKGSLFPPELIPGMISEVRGASALAQLSGQAPIAFTGQTEFIFSMDNDVAIVAEGAKKPAQAATVTAKTIQPLKVVYTMRITDEFMTASEDFQMALLENFGAGFARKLARGLDLMAIHGVNPFDGTAAAAIGTNCFDKADGIQKMTRDAKKDMDATIEDAIALVQGADYDVTGIAMAPAVRSELAAITNNGAKIYPQLAWGSAPGMINGLPVQVNSTVANKGLDLFVAGDFATNFKWGYAKQIPIEVIQYGDPDNTGVDLKGSNQVALRGEAYMGWTIFQPEAFALCASADA